MKIIFLDIDGVMNSEQYYRAVDRKQKNWSRFDPSAVLLIKNLIEEFSPKIVITSTWRFGAIKQLSEELKSAELINYLHKDWKTPQVYPPNRGKEIKMWLDKHPEISEYVIIDDDKEMFEEQEAKLVQTELYSGLKSEHYHKASEILSSERSTKH